MQQGMAGSHQPWRRRLGLRVRRAYFIHELNPAYRLGISSSTSLIQLNPVRAEMVKRPEDYHWSSYACHALGRMDPLIVDHPLYQALGATEEARRMAYRDLFRHELDQDTLVEIRDSLNQGLALGVERFKDEIEAVVARSVRAGKPGRRSAKGLSGLWGEQTDLLFKE